MPQTEQQMWERLQAMAIDNGSTWDLSGNDQEAIKWVIGRLQQLRQLVVNADFVSRARFELYGLCDCIDNTGSPYPSQWAADLITEAKTTASIGTNLERWAG